MRRRGSRRRGVDERKLDARAGGACDLVRYAVGLVVIAGLTAIVGCGQLETEKEKAPADSCAGIHPQPGGWSTVGERVPTYGFDIEYRNDCEESVRTRVSAAAYSRDEKLIDTGRWEAVVPAGQRKWLCRHGESDDFCTFDETVGLGPGDTFAPRRSDRVCYLDEDCPFPEYPELGVF